MSTLEVSVVHWSPRRQMGKYIVFVLRPLTLTGWMYSAPSTVRMFSSTGAAWRMWEIVSYVWLSYMMGK